MHPGRHTCTHVPSLMIIQSVRWEWQCQPDSYYTHPNSQEVNITPVISPVLYIPWPLALLSVCCVTGISFPVAPESLPVVLWFCSWWPVPQVPTRHTWTFVQVVFVFQVVLNLLFQTCYRELPHTTAVIFYWLVMSPAYKSFLTG